MKFITLTGGIITSAFSILLIIVLLIKFATHGPYDPIEAEILTFIAMPLLFLTTTISAWIICDMQKRIRNQNEHL